MLILDEINRADLSRLFGEAFSALELEQRGERIDLSVEDPETEQAAPALDPGEPLRGRDDEPDRPERGADRLRDASTLPAGRSPGSTRARCWRCWRSAGKRRNGSRPWEKVRAGHAAAGESRVSRLNARIATIDELGEQYEVGHTYLFDIVTLLDAATTPRASTFLWTGKGEPKDPVRQLWDLALKPLLAEYLAGLEAERKKELLDDLRAAFTRP